MPDVPVPRSVSTATSLLVDADGQVLDRDGPFLMADDLGVLRGDGVFESLLVVAGVPDCLERHIQRLHTSARMVGMEAPVAALWRGAVDVAIGAWQGGAEMVVRLIVTRGREGSGSPTAYLLADAVTPKAVAQRSNGVAVLALPAGRQLDPDSAPWLLIGAKTLSYAVNMAAIRYAEANGADDVILVAPDGRVLEGPTSSVLVADRGRLLTPPPAAGILRGITVSQILDRAAATGWAGHYRDLSIDDLLDAEGVWLISSVRRGAAVNSIDGRSVAKDPQLCGRVASLAAPWVTA